MPDFLNGNPVAPNQGNATVNESDFLFGNEGQVAPNQGNATPDVQPNQGQQVQQQQGQAPQQVNTQPKKFAGMYETVEQLEQAYKNLQTTYQGTKAQNKSLLEQITPTQQQPATAPQQPVMQPQAQPQFPNIDPNLLAKAWAENPQGTAQLMAQYANMVQAQPQQPVMQAQPQAANNNLMEYLVAKDRYSDFKELEPIMSEILQEKPHLANIEGRFDILHDLAIARRQSATLNQAIQNGIAQGYQQATEKQAVTNTFATGQGTGANNTPPATAEDDIANAIVGVAKNRFIL